MSTLTTNTIQAITQAGQAWILDHMNQLQPAQQASLAEDISQVDWNQLGELIETLVKNPPEPHIPEQIDAPHSLPALPTTELKERYDQAHKHGINAIAEGKVALFTVAGGQGSRLGYDGPKGCYPASPVQQIPLFGMMAEQLLAWQERTGTQQHWYIMTSPINHQSTLSFLQENNYFGLKAEQVHCFPQGMLPAVDSTNYRVLLQSPTHLALAPNGNGGSFKALADHALADMKQRGISIISYIQVDNPLVPVFDPTFIGLHLSAQSQMSSRSLPKAHPFEKVGNFYLDSGRLSMIEYSNLDPSLAEKRREDGSLLLNDGNIAIHLIDCDFAAQMGGSSHGLPYHRAEKKISYWDGQTTITPNNPNAIKLESFVFDALPYAHNPLVLQAIREEVFAPIKNADSTDANWQDSKGDSDSPATSHALQTLRATKWLRAAGMEAPVDNTGQPLALIEMPASVALEADDLQGCVLNKPIIAGDRVWLSRQGKMIHVHT